MGFLRQVMCCRHVRTGPLTPQPTATEEARIGGLLQATADLLLARFLQLFVAQFAAQDLPTLVVGRLSRNSTAFGRL